MSFFLRRKLIDWGFVEPNIYDIMDKYIRGYLTKEQAKSLEKYGKILVNTDLVDIDWDKRFYFRVDCEITRSYVVGQVPSCEMFRTNIERFRIILDRVVDALSEKKEEKLKHLKEVNREKKCKRKMWESI